MTLDELDEKLSVTKRSPKKDALFQAVMNVANRDKVVGERGPRLAGPLVPLGNYEQDTSWFGDDSVEIRNKHGIPVGPGGKLYGELDTSKYAGSLVREGKRTVTDKSILSGVIGIPDIDSRYMGTMKKAKDKLLNVKYTVSDGNTVKTPAGKPVYGWSDNDLNEMGLALGPDAYVSNVSNTFAHESAHMIGNHSFKRSAKNYGDRHTELIAQISGNRNKYDKDMINKVHPFIDFTDGKFNIDPAIEYLRRIGNMPKIPVFGGNDKRDQTQFSKSEEKRYLKLLQKEADKLNSMSEDELEKYKNARFNDGDIYDWRGHNSGKDVLDNIDKTSTLYDIAISKRRI